MFIHNKLAILMLRHSCAEAPFPDGTGQDNLSRGEMLPVSSAYEVRVYFAFLRLTNPAINKAKPMRIERRMSSRRGAAD